MNGDPAVSRIQFGPCQELADWLDTDWIHSLGSTGAASYLEPSLPADQGAADVVHRMAREERNQPASAPGMRDCATRTPGAPLVKRVAAMNGIAESSEPNVTS
jgi:hypothetical protein